MDSNNKSYKNKGEKLNESQYVDKIINHFKSDLIGERIELKKTYSLSTDEYIELLQHEVNLINSLKGEVFDTSDPKWFGTGSYEFTFEIDSSYLYNYKLPPPNENVLFTRESIEVDVDVDVTGTVFLESTMRDNPGRDWTLREAIENRHMGHIIISEIRDIIYTILEQRLPLLKNLETLDVCNVKEEWVTKLSNNKGNLTESKEDIDKDFLDKVVNSLIGETNPTSKKHVSVFTPFFVPEVEKSWVLTAHRCKEIGIAHPESYMVPSIISDHLKDVYSLRSIKEMDYVMNKYYFNIYNKYFRKFFDDRDKNTLNEANYTAGKTDKFLNKMVDFMVDTTELVELDEQPYIRIKYPFINYNDRKISHKWYEAVPRYPFIEGMVDNYGLTDDESEYVLEKYSDKLRSRVFSVRKQISDNVND